MKDYFSGNEIFSSSFNDNAKFTPKCTIFAIERSVYLKKNKETVMIIKNEENGGF